MKGRLEAAIEDYKEGNHRSIRQCSVSIFNIQGSLVHSQTHVR